MKASVALFKKAVEYPVGLEAEVPQAVLDAVKQVIETKGSAILRLAEGFYVIEYNQFGPFRENFGDEWLPVYIARIEKWSSGGITKIQMSQAEQNV